MFSDSFRSKVFVAKVNGVRERAVIEAGTISQLSDYVITGGE